MKGQTTLILLCSFLWSFWARADPSNVLVGDLTFTRPEKWIWQAPPEKSPAVTQFIVPSDSEKKSPAEVRLFLGPKNGKSIAKIWRSHFLELKDDPKIGEEKKKIGQREIT